MRGIIVFLLSILVLFGCSQENIKGNITINLNKAMEEANVQHGKIYHIEIVKDGVLIFYKNQEYLNAGFIRKTPEKWKWVTGGGSVELQPKEDISWIASNYDEVPLNFFYGVISNPDIKQVKTSKPDGTLEETAKIVKTKEDLELWFTLYDEPVKAPFNVIGFSNNGEELYQ
jgi:hypothetical protein